MGGRLLLADDSLSIHRMVKNALANEGFEILAVTSGDHAEQKLEEFNPDIVVADVFMPGKDGYELCDLIKKSAGFSHVPVLLLVGSFEPFDQVQASRVRADGHLIKPFQPQVFAQAVAHYLGGGAGDGAAAGAPPSPTQAGYGSPGYGAPGYGSQPGYGAPQDPDYGSQPGYGAQPDPGYGSAPPAYGSQGQPEWGAQNNYQASPPPGPADYGSQTQNPYGAPPYGSPGPPPDGGNNLTPPAPNTWGSQGQPGNSSPGQWNGPSQYGGSGYPQQTGGYGSYPPQPAYGAPAGYGAQCKNHPGVAAMSRCAGCAEMFCQNCMIDMYGQKYCGACKIMAVQGQPVMAEATRSCKTATHALIYSILSLFLCPLIFAPLAIYKGLEAKKEIDADPLLTGSGKVTAAIIIAVAGIALWVLVKFAAL